MTDLERLQTRQEWEDRFLRQPPSEPANQEISDG